MVSNIKSIKRFQKRKIDQYNQSQRKFAKKKGGAINVPIYHYITPPEEDICSDLTNLNTKITNKAKVLIQNLEPHVLQASSPLYNFKQVIYSMCKINDIPIDDSHPNVCVCVTPLSHDANDSAQLAQSDSMRRVGVRCMRGTGRCAQRPGTLKWPIAPG